MRYSIDLRKRVLDFIHQGGRKAEASRRFQVSRTAIYQGLAAPDPLTYEKPGPRKPRLLDYEALRKHVADFPDQTLAERAEVFGVSKEGIHYALGKCGITRKKVSGIRSDAQRKEVPIKPHLPRRSEKKNGNLFLLMSVGSQQKHSAFMAMPPRPTRRR